MRYIDVAHCSLISPKILGTYEKELHSVIQEILHTPFERIVDIGAAEGYYAVGLAYAKRRSAVDTKVIVFETEESARTMLLKLAKLNGIEDLEVRHRCEPENLAAVLDGPGRTLIICDVEGFESELLDPRTIVGLMEASVLVELHDFFRPGASDTIRQAFDPTHVIEEIHSAERTWQDFPIKGFFARLLPGSLVRRAMGEGRPQRMTWFWMKPRAIGKSFTTEPLS